MAGVALPEDPLAARDVTLRFSGLDAPRQRGRKEQREKRP
jgi:hypothetical protein